MTEAGQTDGLPDGTLSAADEFELYVRRGVVPSRRAIRVATGDEWQQVADRVSRLSGGTPEPCHPRRELRTP